MNLLTPNRYCRIGILAPAVLALALIADVGLRVIPLDKFSFRAWEAVKARTSGQAPFAPNRHYRNDRCYGDLANLAHRPELRQFHQEIFTTDEFGFRNPVGGWTNDPPCAILTGTSFSAGCGVSDDQSLSAQLSQRLGCRVYNVAPDSQLEVIRSVARRLGMQSGVVFYEVLARESIPRIPKSNAANAAARSDPAVDRGTGEGPAWTVSRLKILAERAYRRVENDRLLPRGGSPYVVSRELRNGYSMLFLKNRLSRRTQDAAAASAYYRWLAEQLQRDRLSLCIFLVPEKSDVYQELLNDRAPVEPADNGYFTQIEEQLKTAGIPVANLDPIFRRQAAEDLPRGQYIYLRDDTHWNPRGIAVAADTIAQTWRAVAPVAPQVRGRQ